ncbi:clathrin interactor 1a isoform X2 [Cheilinus undulatus]|uniref:clathrin interactor 1a isoform X2 n=1 Tax=Cheilinus undulatus TaxID=241271 RepID=UPI001BD1D39E|nr:clathrin interactor 1a isoform X2 [Cheilinus undulatus]
MLNMWKVRELVDKATNVVMNYSEVESKVREATNDDPWGPSGQLMGEISRATFMYEQFPEVMNMLWARMLRDNKKNWRRVYKSLLLLSHLIKNGSERVVTSAREHLYDLRSLESYHFVDENGKDQGVNVRQKVKELVEFVQDDDRLREERKKAKKNKDKYVGINSDSVGYRSYSGDRYDTSDSRRDKWDDDWGNKGQFPFSEKLGEISDKIGSTIDDTINRFRKKDRDDSPDRFSDNEDDRGRSSHNGQSAKDFKDEEETVTTKSVHIVQATETTATRKRGGVPSKIIDMGAAANYTGDKSPSTTTKQPQPAAAQPASTALADLLMVDTTPTKPPATDLISGFADFSSPAASVGLSSGTAPASSSNGDFGEWNAFPGGQMPASAQTVDNSGNDLFGSMTAGPALAPAPAPVSAASTAPPSADLFDLMGPTQTLTASQSLNFSMSSTQSMSSTGLPQSMSQPLQTMGGPLQPQSAMPLQPLQPGMASQGLGAKGSLPSTWSDPSVNISLDFLGPGAQPPKQSQPSLNTLQQGNQAPANMLSQGFSSMSIGPTTVRPPVNPMMHPGAGMGMGMGMGMAPNQGMMGMGMGMGMNMGMPQGAMTMGMPQGAMTMGMPAAMGMGMNPSVVQQPKPDAFADFANFGK